VTLDAGRVDDSARQQPAEAATALLRPYVEPFHFARPVAQRAHRHASSGPAVHARDEQPAGGPCIRAGKLRELAVEALEAEVDAERGLVFEEELAGLLDLGVQDRYVLY